MPINWVAVAAAAGAGYYVGGPVGGAIGVGFVVVTNYLSQPTPPPVTSDPQRVLGGNQAV